MNFSLARIASARVSIATFGLTFASMLTPPLLGAQPQEIPRGYVRLSMPLATRDLVRGDTLRSSDIEMRDTTLMWRWNVAPDTTRASSGWVTRRAIGTGEVLRSPAVMPPPAVTVGSRVSVIYKDGPVELRMSGISTSTAAIGAEVSVRIDGVRRLDGTVVAPNTVRLR